MFCSKQKAKFASTSGVVAASYLLMSAYIFFNCMEKQPSKLEALSRHYAALNYVEAQTTFTTVIGKLPKQMQQAVKCQIKV